MTPARPHPLEDGHRHVLADGKQGDDAARVTVARHIADSLALCMRHVAAEQIGAADADRPTCGREQASNGVADVALAGAGQPGKSDAFAHGDLQADT